MTSVTKNSVGSKYAASLHLRLTNSDWAEHFRQLTRAELGVLYYIRTLDPFGDRTLEIDTTEVGQKLGLHRTSVSRALIQLANKQLITMSVTQIKVSSKVNNRALTLLKTDVPIAETGTASTEPLQSKDSSLCAPMHKPERSRTQVSADAQACASMHISEHPCTTVELEPLHSSDSGISHTLHTLENFNTNNEVSVLEKFEEKLKLHQVYLKIWNGQEVVPNPKIEPIRQLVSKLPQDKAESHIRAFLAWLKTAKNVRDVYKALEQALIRGWEYS